MKYADPIEMDCPKCEADDALIVTERFESPVTCTKCGQVFEMDWDEDGGGNVYGLPIWPPEVDIGPAQAQPDGLTWPDEFRMGEPPSLPPR